MECYILLLHQNEQGPSMSPEEMQAVIAKYKAWGQRLREAGKFVASDKLEDGTARILRSDAGKVRITDGPFAETKDVIGGYFVIQVANWDEAVEASRDCPHLHFGFGPIEIRRIQVV